MCQATTVWQARICGRLSEAVLRGILVPISALFLPINRLLISKYNHALKCHLISDWFSFYSRRSPLNMILVEYSVFLSNVEKIG